MMNQKSTSLLLSLTLLLSYLLSPLDCATPPDPMTVLRDMAQNVSSYRSNLQDRMNSQASLVLPPDFQALIRSSNPISSSLSQLLNRTIQPDGSSSSTDPEILNRETNLLDPTQAAVDAAALGVAAQATGLASAISYTVSGGIATIASSLSIGLAEIATLTGPYSLLLAEAQFAQALYSDLSANSDILTNTPNKIMTMIQDLVKRQAQGGVKQDIKNYIAQLTNARDLLNAAAKRFRA